MKPYTVLEQLSIDTTKSPMFFGPGLGIQRYDQAKYPFLLDLFKEQCGFFWRPERFDLSKDRADFSTLTKAEQHIFVKNLQYQICMDSVISRGIDPMMKFGSINELEPCLVYWKAFEVMHSYSYTYIISNVFGSEGTKIFDDILRDEEILARAESVKLEFDRLANMGDSQDDQRRQLLLALVSTQILEGVRFYLSFACGFSFAEPPSARMVGNASILKEICRDENVHVSITQKILSVLASEESEGFVKLWKEMRDEIVNMFRVAAHEEKSWCRYLFSKGSIFGISEDTMTGFVEWMTDRRLEKLGLPVVFGRTINPIGGWMDKYLMGDLCQVAPQETEIESYKTGSTQNDIKSVDFASFSLDG